MPTATTACRIAPWLERHAENLLGPLEHDELQRRAGAPEQRRDGQRDLAELVAPQRAEAVAEVDDQPHRRALLVRIARAGVRDPEVERRGREVHGHDDRDRRFAGRVDAGVDHGMSNDSSIAAIFGDTSTPPTTEPRMIEPTVEALDPAVGDDQLLRRQQLGEDAVLGRRVGRRAEADQRIGEQRVRARRTSSGSRRS